LTGVVASPKPDLIDPYAPCPAPPTGPLNPRPSIFELEAGTVVHRMWKPGASGRPGTDYNPGYGDPTRFAPIKRPIGAKEGKRIGTIYTGETVDVAFYESLLRDLPVGPANVAAEDIYQYNYCKFSLGRKVKLASFFKASVRAWGITDQQLIQSIGRDAYLSTVEWAEKIYDDTDLDGIVWMSRQDPTSKAYLFFEDRMHNCSFLNQYIVSLSHPDGAKLVKDITARDSITILSGI
jgi:hypothetical protein